jgi:MFS family permease
MEILSSSVATMPFLRSTSLQPRSRNDPNTKMAMMPQFLGFMLEAYDMAPVLVMAPILISVFASPKVTAAWQYTLIVFTYSITMASRPIASAIFGRYADNHPAISVRLDHRRRGLEDLQRNKSFGGSSRIKMESFALNDFLIY